MLDAYLRDVSRLVSGWDDTIVERYDQELVSDRQVNLRIRMTMGGGYLLAISEAIRVENGALVFLSYSYHFQDAANRMIFRYDDTPHHRHLSTSPHHKHLSDAVLPSAKPTIGQVLQEATDAISEPSQGSQQ